MKTSKTCPLCQAVIQGQTKSEGRTLYYGHLLTHPEAKEAYLKGRERLNQLREERHSIVKELNQKYGYELHVF